jgi:EAL domain-containing protein (putative c-di-GMP-specific phosphodiesterase class I)
MPFCGEETKLEDLFKHADTAMYQAKEAGRNALRFFDPAMQYELEIRMGLEADLRNALVKGQISLYYQRQVDAEGKVVGAEALLRWKHPRDGMIPPSKFIPIAEHSGLIMEIGAWVVQTACEQLKAWQSHHGFSDIHLSVNVSARQFRQLDFVEKVLDVIQSTGIRPELLKLELTESLVLDSLESSIVKMQALRDAGVKISLDDFGTGQSSLSYLKRLPLDQLKIDQSFVRDLPADAGDAAIVKTIIAMAKNLGMEVIAEGVETEEQRAFLEQNGCLLYQGYLFGEPVPISEF